MDISFRSAVCLTWTYPFDRMRLSFLENILLDRWESLKLQNAGIWSAAAWPSRRQCHHPTLFSPPPSPFSSSPPSPPCSNFFSFFFSLLLFLHLFLLLFLNLLSLLLLVLSSPFSSSSFSCPSSSPPPRSSSFSSPSSSFFCCCWFIIPTRKNLARLLKCYFSLLFKLRKPMRAFGCLTSSPAWQRGDLLHWVQKLALDSG